MVGGVFGHSKSDAIQKYAHLLLLRCALALVLRQALMFCLADINGHCKSVLYLSRMQP